MLNWLKTKQVEPAQTRLWLLSATINDKPSFKARFSEFAGADYQAELQRQLQEIFAIPKAEAHGEYTQHDFGLAVHIDKYQGGVFDAVGLHPYLIPIFWRPKIRIQVCLTNLGKHKQVFKQRYQAVMPWGQFLDRTIGISSWFRFTPHIRQRHVNELLGICCQQAVEDLQGWFSELN